MRIELNIDGVQTPFELGEDGKLTAVKIISASATGLSIPNISTPT